MQRVLSTYLFRQHKLTTATLAEVHAAGFGAVELFCARSHFDYRDPVTVRETSEWFEDHPLKMHSLHAPTSRESGPARESGVPISISDPERLRRLDAVDEMKRTLDVAEAVAFRFLVLHLGASRESFDLRRMDAAFSSLEHLVVFAKQRGVTIALENTPGELATPANLRHFIADTRLRDLRVCFDTGHAHMEDGVLPSWEAVRDLTVTTHFHDNHGDKDEHLLPFDGTIDWPAALHAMSTAPAAVGGLPCVLELRENGSQKLTLAQAATVFERFEQARAAV